MSWLTEAAHSLAGGGGSGRQGLLTQDEPQHAGILDILGGLVHLPFDAINSRIQDIRAQPEILRAQMEAMRNRMAAMRQVQAVLNGQGGGQGNAAPQDPNLPQGVSVMGAGGTVGGIPQDSTGAPDASQLPPQSLIMPPSAPPPPMSGTDRYRAVAPALAMASLAGSRHAGDASTALDRAQEHMSPINGVPVDDRTGQPMGPRVGVNNSNVNGWQVDSQDPNSTGNFYGAPPAAGAVPTRDANGNPTGWTTAPGAAGAIATASGAEQQGRTAYSPQTVNDQGHSRTGLGIDIFGGHQTYEGQSHNNQTYGDATANAAALRYGTMQTNGTAASTRINQLGQIGQLLDGYDGNAASPMGVQLGRFATSLGVHIDGLNRQEAAQAIAQGIALSLHNQLPGPMSNADRDYLTNMTPNLAMTDEGRRQLIAAQMATAQREVFMAHAARQWQQRYGQIDAADPQGRNFDDQMQRYANEHPMFGTRH